MSIGEALASARVERGLSVEDVSEATRVRATLIRMIEADDFSACGGSFYARGHIRAIARTVGIDPGPLVAEFDAVHGEPDTKVGTGIIERESRARPERNGPRWGSAMVASIMVVMCIVAAYSLLGGFGPSRGTAHLSTPPGSASPSPSVTPSSPPTSRAPSPAHSPRPSLVPTNALAYNAGDGVMMRMRIIGDRAWVSVSDSTGQTMFQGTLVHGQTKDFRDPKLLSIVVGAPAAVDLIVNGKDLGPAGPADKVVHLVFHPGDPTAQARG